MSNKPKGWAPMPGNRFSEAELYYRRLQLNGIRCLERRNSSRRQGSKPMRVMMAEMRAISQDR